MGVWLFVIFEIKDILNNRNYRKMINNDDKKMKTIYEIDIHRKT